MTEYLNDYVDPEVSHEDIFLLLARCAIALDASPDVGEKYYCDRGPDCELAYLPPGDMKRPEKDPQAHIIDERYPHGAIICLTHTSMWPASEEERGKYKHAWFEMYDRGELGDNTQLAEKVRMMLGGR